MYSRLLYLSFKARKLTIEILELNKIKTCELVKTHTTQRSFFLITPKQKRWLAAILLHISYADHRDYQIPFYHNAHDKVGEMKRLFQKARYWQRIISSQQTAGSG